MSRGKNEGGPVRRSFRTWGLVGSLVVALCISSMIYLWAAERRNVTTSSGKRSSSAVSNSGEKTQPKALPPAAAIGKTNDAVSVQSAPATPASSSNVSAKSTSPVSKAAAGPLALTDVQMRKIEKITALAEGYEYTQEQTTKTMGALFSDSFFEVGKRFERSDEISQAWKEGKWEDAVKTAEQRLSRNPSDLPALFIKAEYGCDTVALDDYLDTVEKILVAVKSIDTPTLTSIRPALVTDLKLQCEQLKALTSERAATVKRNSEDRQGRRFGLGWYLQACEADGVL